MTSTTLLVGEKPTLRFMNINCHKDFKNWEQQLDIYFDRLRERGLKKEEAAELFRYISILEEALDKADSHDLFGTQGWKRNILGED